MRINKNKQNKFKTNKTTFLNVFNERKGWNVVFLYRLNNRWNIWSSLCLVQALLAAPWTTKVPGSFKPFSNTWFMVFWREKTSYQIQLIENMIQLSKQRYNIYKFFILCVQVSSVFYNTYTLTSPAKLMSTRYHAMSEWNCNSTNIYLKRILHFHSKKYI